MIGTIFLGRATGLAIAAGLTALLCLLTNLPTSRRSRSVGRAHSGRLLTSSRWPLANRSKPEIL
jgi:hypothetical protein